MGTEEIKTEPGLSEIVAGARHWEWVEPHGHYLLWFGRGIHAVTPEGEEVAYWRIAGGRDEALASMAAWRADALDYGGF